MHHRGKLLVAALCAASGLGLISCVPTVVAKPPVSVKAPKPKPKPKPPSAKPARPASSAPVAHPSPAASPPASSIPDWSQYRVDTAGTGYNPSERVINSATVSRLREVWHVPARLSSLANDPPLVTNGVVYAAFPWKSDTSNVVETTVGGFDVETGATRWKVTVTGAEQNLIGVAGGLVILQSYDSGNETTIRALDAATGATRWTWAAPGFQQVSGGSVFLAQGRLFIPLRGYYALDPKTGRELFLIGCTDDDGVNCPLNSGPAIADNSAHLFLPGYAGAGVEADATNGRRLQLFGALNARTMTGPMLGGGLLFASGGFNWLNDGSHRWTGDVAAFDPATCRPQEYCSPRWETSILFGASEKAYANGVVYTANGSSRAIADPEISALDASTGKVLWQGTYVPPADNYSGYTHLAVAGDVLYVTATSNLYAFSIHACAATSNCRPSWQHPIVGRFTQAPIVTGGRLIYTDYTGVHALGVG